MTPKSKSEGGIAGVSGEQQGDQTEPLQGISDIQHGKDHASTKLSPPLIVICCLFESFTLTNALQLSNSLYQFIGVGSYF